MPALPLRSLAWLSTAGLTLLMGSAQAAFAEDPAPAPKAAAAEVSTATSGTLLLSAQSAAAQTTPAAQPAPAPEPPPPSVTGGVTVDLFSHYVWRGFALTDRFAFQPSVFVSTRGLTVTSWSSWSSTGADDDGFYPDCFDSDCPVLREHDLTIDYTRAVGKAAVSVGYINYLFPGFRTDTAKAADAVGATNEIYSGVTFAVPGNPFVKAYFDVDGDDGADVSRGTYLQFGVSQAIPIAKGKATLTPMFSIAYNFKQWIAENDWNDANLGVKLSLPVNSHFTIAPAAYLSIGLNDTVKLVGYGDGDTKFYGGVSFITTF
jgi:hypothetical protein